MGPSRASHRVAVCLALIALCLVSVDRITSNSSTSSRSLLRAQQQSLALVPTGLDPVVPKKELDMEEDGARGLTVHKDEVKNGETISAADDTTRLSVATSGCSESLQGKSTEEPSSSSCPLQQRRERIPRGSFPEWAEAYFNFSTLLAKRGDGTNTNYSLPSRLVEELRTLPETEHGLCTDSTRCSFKHGCVQDGEGVCYKPDFELLHPGMYRPFKKGNPGNPEGGRNVYPKEELKCSWMPDKPSPLPELKKLDANAATSPEETVKLFKHVTGDFFQKWYDWDAPIKQVDPEQGFTMRGRHVGPDKVYVVENFCFRMATGGGWTGYRPNMEKFRGGNTMGTYRALVRPNAPSDDLGVFREPPHFVPNTVPLPPLHLDSVPKWYIDRKLAIMPLPRFWWPNHPAPALMRTGALMANIESAWPSENAEASALTARDDVTVAYVNWVGQNTTFNSGSLPVFSTLATKSHLLINAAYQQCGKSARSREPCTTMMRWLNHTEKGREMLRENLPFFEAASADPQMVCFKEAVFYQSCYNEIDCRIGVNGRKSTERNQWPLWGYKNPVTQRFISRRFRACANAADDTENIQDGTNMAPVVLFPQRSKTKSLVQAQHLLLRLHEILRTIFPPPRKPKLISFEMNDRTTIEMVNLYTKVDIIVSTWNSGFMMGFLGGNTFKIDGGAGAGGGDGAVPAAAAAVQGVPLLGAGPDVNRATTVPATNLVGPPMGKSVALGIEIDAPKNSLEPGLDKNPYADYGSAYKAMNVLAVENRSSTYVKRVGLDLSAQVDHYINYTKRQAMGSTYVPPQWFDRVVKSGLCRWREEHGINSKDDPCSDATNTEQLRSAYTEDFSKMLPETGGVSRDLRFQIRSFVPELGFQNYSRLLSLYNSLLSGKLDHIWQKFSHSLASPQRPALVADESPKLMLAYTCPAWEHRGPASKRIAEEIEILEWALPTKTVEWTVVFDTVCPAMDVPVWLECVDLPPTPPGKPKPKKRKRDGGLPVGCRKAKHPGNGGPAPLLVVADVGVRLPIQVERLRVSKKTTVLRLGANATWWVTE